MLDDLFELIILKPELHRQPTLLYFALFKLST